MNRRLDSEAFDMYITSTFDIAYALSGALDLVNPLINNHHQRVAFIAGSIAREAGCSDKEIENIILASLIHDIGVIMDDEFRELAEYAPQKPENELCHAVVGAQLMSCLKLLPDLPPIIKYHHTPYAGGVNPIADEENEEIPDSAGIVHLADRIDVLLKRDIPALDQRDDIRDNIKIFSGIKFNPVHVDAFLRLADREYFWFDIEEHEKYKLLKYNFRFSHIQMNILNMLETAKLLSRIIDFRCVFTANHSAGVAAVAESIGTIMGYGLTDRRGLKIAGYLHDIGKLAVPPHILYKNDSLTDDEMLILKKHPYYTYSILNNFQIFNSIKNWAAFHHENLNGSGYPFHLTDEKLDTGCRILAISDVFTALTEDRPYRESLTEKNVTGIMSSMVSEGKLDKDISDIIMSNYGFINEIRRHSQLDEMREFERFKKIIQNNRICTRNKKFISMLG